MIKENQTPIFRLETLKLLFFQSHQIQKNPKNLVILKKIVLSLLFVIILIFNLYNVYAGLGITPAITKIDFQPNMSFLISYGVLKAGPNTTLLVYADGDLSEYVRFDKTNLTGQEGFTVYVDLPGYINKSGKNRLYIKVKEYNNQSSGIGVVLEVGSLILIKVPYPGKYAEINSFSAESVNEGEPVRFYLELDNLGNEEINPNAKVDVYSNGNLFDSYSFPTKKINPNSLESFEIITNKEYKIGSYEAFLSVNLNDVNNTILKDNKTFYVGSLSVYIIDWTREANKSRINTYNIQIESKWNNDLKNVYAEVNITKDGKEVDFFKTPSIELKRWETANLKGFFNAEDLEEGKYKANITLFYEDKATSKLTDIQVIDPEKPKRNMTMLIIYGMIIGNVVVIIIIIAVYFVLKRRKDATKNKWKKK